VCAYIIIMCDVAPIAVPVAAMASRHGEFLLCLCRLCQLQLDRATIDESLFIDGSDGEGARLS
jgi:hypothetical protein